MDEKKAEETKRYSIIDGSFWSIMGNSGISYLAPFAIAINAPLQIVGAMTSVPALLDGAGQMAASRMKTRGGRGELATRSVAVQAIFWLFLAGLAICSPNISSDGTYVFLVFFAAAIFFFGGFADPFWFSMMGDVVKDEDKATWFGKRNRINIIVGFITLLVAGLLLDNLKSNPILGFVLLFLSAGVSRLIGSYFLSLHYDPPKASGYGSEPGREVKKYAQTLFLLYFAINVSSGYSAYYALGFLGLDYLQFSVALASFTIMQAIAAPHWGRLMERYGAKKVLVASAGLMAPLPIITSFMHDAPGITLSYAYSGLMISGVNLAILNYMYEITSPQVRIKARGYSSFSIGIGTFLGVAAGGAAMSLFGGTGQAAFYAMFFASSICRFAAVAFANFSLKEPKPARENAKVGEMMVKIVTVYPIKGVMYDLNALARRFQ